VAEQESVDLFVEIADAHRTEHWLVFHLPPDRIVTLFRHVTEFASTISRQLILTGRSLLPASLPTLLHGGTPTSKRSNGLTVGSAPADGDYSTVDFTVPPGAEAVEFTVRADDPQQNLGIPPLLSDNGGLPSLGVVWAPHVHGRVEPVPSG
jgi:hypothetical protein